MAVSAVSHTPLTAVRRVVVGTAGHIDHGKTTLLKALTGIDCDRWAEEKARGITIDLGFAHLTESDLQVGFVDVPGHERFIHNALAGLGGIRIMLLVVAADEGVMPQTREHLAICSLLGIPAGLVALTKTDLVSADLLELAELEITEVLDPTPFASAPILRVSSQTGEGLAELKAALLDLAARFEVPTDTQVPARLPIDRAFHLRGMGVVVTGTLASGVVRVGEPLDLLPSSRSIRVRSIQVHGSSRDEAVAGERTSLQLSGASLDELERGLQLVAPGAFEPAVSLCARFTLLADAPAPVRQPTDIRLHLYSSEVLGTLRPLLPREIKPGETGLVELRLGAPVVAVRGDRFIIRRPSPQTTLGGGQILDPKWRRRRGPDLGPVLAALEGTDRDVLLLWIRQGAERGVESETLERRLGVRAERLAGELKELVAEGKILATPSAQGRAGRWIARTAYERVTARAQKVLADYFHRNRLAPSMPKAEAVRRILPAVPSHLVHVYLSWLEEQKVLALDGDLVMLPGRKVELKAEEAGLAATLLGRFEADGLAPPTLEQLRAAFPADTRVFDTAIRYLRHTGKLIRLPNDMFIAVVAVEGLRGELLATGWQRFSVPQFKERFGLTRKWAIPLLEHFDSAGVTRRIGDDRMVVGSSS